MSYSTWEIHGFGVRVDDIKTTPKRLLKLAACKPKLLKKVRDYLNDGYTEEYKEEALTMDDFNDLDGGSYCGRGVSYILYNVIPKDKLNVIYCDDYNGYQYILYTPSFPWGLTEYERNLTEDTAREIFAKYIKILTDEPVTIGYYMAENGG